MEEVGAAAAAAGITGAAGSRGLPWGLRGPGWRCCLCSLVLFMLFRCKKRVLKKKREKREKNTLVVGQKKKKAKKKKKDDDDMSGRKRRQREEPCHICNHYHDVSLGKRELSLLAEAGDQR